MKELYEDLHDACDMMSRELGDLVDKVHDAGGKMTNADLDVLDKLTHSVKSIKTTMAMMDAEDGDSNMNRRSYDDGRAYNDGYGSYARGRSARRDSMGRYSNRRAYDGDRERM